MKRFNEYLTYVLLLLFVGVSELSGQSNSDGPAAQYDFEDASEWQIPASSHWSSSSAKSVSGDRSLLFSRTTSTDQAINSINTDYTITEVRTARSEEGVYIVASSYEGTLIGINYDGGILWKNELSGYMNHDLWADDLTGDGIDEIVVANADGTIYCLSDQGEELWNFKMNDAPMYAVCIISNGNDIFVVGGGFDKNIYYLSAEGELLKTLASNTYSEEKPWGDGIIPEKFTHVPNFIRPVKRGGKNDALAILGTNNHMQVRGSIYMFEIMADDPYDITKLEKSDVFTVVGDFRPVDVDLDGNDEILIGTSGHQSDAGVALFDLDDKSFTSQGPNMKFGYRVIQPMVVPGSNGNEIVSLAGSEIFIYDTEMQSQRDHLVCKYSFNDMWYDQENQKMILASSQSGGSAVHVVDVTDSDWKSEYETLDPPGKIQKIINNTQSIREQIPGFSKPDWEREPLPVYLMTENYDTPVALSTANDIKANYSSPIFLGGSFTNLAENWDRSAMPNAKYRDKRDSRRNYVMTQQEALDLITPWFDGYPGAAYWGGHGNDPYMFQLETTKQVMDEAEGKKTVLIYPELEDHSDDFVFVMEDLFYPLAEHAKVKNGNIFVRTKHNFWQGNIYLSMWDRMTDGEFADIFVPALEETTDKSMELTLAGRLGIWASGSVNQWGTRCVPDNTSYDRSRQHSHQRLPNHFLRTYVYHISSGAQYINNFSNVNQDYISVLWELIAKGVIYVPKREEIVSFSPVHLSIHDPDEHYMNESSNVKWSTFYDQEFEENNSFVFSRLNGSWPAAPVTEWDFSRYAANVKERRSDFLPSYENGMVLITPPQNGINAKTDVPRGALKDHLHPLYEDILKEYITDGRHYISQDGAQQFDADSYHVEIKNDIENLKDKIPLTISGDVSWVVAQTAPKHLRLTIIDGGYINPDDREAIISFHTVNPVNMKDILSNETFDLSNTEAVVVDVPCGAFRFIDIELTNELD